MYYLSFHEATLFPQVSNLTFHKSIKPRMQTENLGNNNHEQFYVLLNTNQIKRYTYPDLLKENPLLRKFLSTEKCKVILPGW